MALAGLAVDPDVVPEAAALPERLGAHRAREVAIPFGVRQALVAFVGPKSDLLVLVILWFKMLIQGDTTGSSKPPVDFRTNVPFLPGLAWSVHAKAELLF